MVFGAFIMGHNKERYIVPGVPRLSPEFIDNMREINPIRLLVSDNVERDNLYLKIPINRRAEKWKDYVLKIFNSNPNDLEMEKIEDQITQSMKKESILGAAITLEVLVSSTKSKGKKELSPKGLIVVPEEVANQVVRKYDEMRGNVIDLIKRFRRSDPVAYSIIHWLTNTKQIKRVIGRITEETNSLMALQGQIHKFQEFYYNTLILQQAIYDAEDQETGKN